LFADLFTAQLYNCLLLKNSPEKEKKMIFKTDYFSYLVPRAAAQTPQCPHNRATSLLVAAPAHRLGWAAPDRVFWLQRKWNNWPPPNVLKQHCKNSSGQIAY